MRTSPSMSEAMKGEMGGVDDKQSCHFDLNTDIRWVSLGLTPSR